MNQKDYLKVVLVSGVVSIVAVVVVGAGFFGWVRSNPEYFALNINKKSYVSDKPLDYNLHPIESVIVKVVKDANPAVVAITISRDVPVYERYYRSAPSPFGDFFGDGFFNFGFPELRQNGTEKREVGGGSGFLVSSDGYIVTNRHVVSDEKAEYTVFTNDGEKYEAVVVARDPALDLAVIKIEGKDFSYLPFGDSDQLEVGQSVIAIGNALAEFRNTVSVGIVSGLARSIVAGDNRGEREALDHLIQTDAAINQGNSGGPLLNLAGEVIGVNVAVASGAENIGFALSANSVKSAVESVKENGKIIRPFLGVRYIEINEELKKKNNLKFDYGVLVQRGDEPGDLAVIPGSPADKAGIVENDIILEVDGVKLNEGKSLVSIIRTKTVGETVRLKIIHKGKEKIVDVKLEVMN